MSQISDYKKSLDLKPKSWRYDDLAWVQRKNKDYKGAINSYTKAIEVATEIENRKGKALAKWYTYRGSLQEKIGNYYEACQDWKKGAELGDVYELYSSKYWCRD